MVSSSRSSRKESCKEATVSHGELTHPMEPDESVQIFTLWDARLFQSLTLSGA